MEDRLNQIEKKLRAQRVYTLLSFFALGLALLVSFKDKNDDIIRAKGIVIIDNMGRERILIGAPIPAAKNRVRTDLTKVKEIWGKDFPKEYLDWYKEYNHSTNGMLVLDENGFDRVALGSTVPDPNIGKRIGPATGILINDEQGYERSGYNLIKVKGGNRMVLGLDRTDGTEGTILSIMEDGTAGLNVMNDGQRAFLGNAPKNSFKTTLNKSFFGLILRDKTSVKHSINIEEK